MTGRPIAASLAAVLLWALYLVGTRIVFAATTIDPFAYALCQMLVGGLFMVALAGRGRVAWLQLLNGWTAIYGLLRTSVIGTTSLALVYLPAGQSSLLGSINVPMAAVAEAWLPRKRPPAIEFLGNGLLLLAALLVVTALPDIRAFIGLLWQLVSEASAVLSGVIVWRHPANQGDSIRERARTTGVLLIAAGLVMMAGWWLLAEGGLASQPFSDQRGSFGDPMLWLYGSAAGVLVRGPGTYISLYVYRYGGIHLHMAGLAAIPAATIALEQLAIALGWLRPVHLGVVELAAVGLVLAAAIILLRAKTRNAAT